MKQVAALVRVPAASLESPAAAEEGAEARQ
jgi:hypothetical protein